MEIVYCDTSLYTMDHPDFIVCSFMENSNGFKRVYSHMRLWNSSAKNKSETLKKMWQFRSNSSQIFIQIRLRSNKCCSQSFIQIRLRSSKCCSQSFIQIRHLNHFMEFWHLLHMRTAVALMRLHVYSGSSWLLAHTR